MNSWIIQHKDLLGAYASIATLISLFFVFLAALANRRQNILKTAPIFTLIFANDSVTSKNLNKKFAYNLRSEKFIHISNDDNPLALYPPGRHVYTLKFRSSNYMSADEATKPLDIYIDGKRTEGRFPHFLYSRLLEQGKTGIYLFYNDAQKYRFAMKVKSTHDQSTINNQVIFEIVMPATYIPWYRLTFWLSYTLRTSWTYAKIVYGFTKYRLQQKRSNSSE